MHVFLQYSHEEQPYLVPARIDEGRDDAPDSAVPQIREHEEVERDEAEPHRRQRDWIDVDLEHLHGSRILPLRLRGPP